MGGRVCRLGLALVLLAASAPGPEHWLSAVDFTLVRPWPGAVCDPQGLKETNCGREAWRHLLALLCEHCHEGHCTSDAELTRVAHEVLHMYVSMVANPAVNVGGQLDTFSCKLGLLGAMVYHSEHAGLEFKPPQVFVESLDPPQEFDFTVGLEDRFRVDEAADIQLRGYGLVVGQLAPGCLSIKDAHGVPTSVTGILDEDRFPLYFKFRMLDSEREFFNMRRHVLIQGELQVTMNLHIPVMSLAPYPLHTAKLRALRWIGQERYDEFLVEVSEMLSAAGVFHFLLHQDYTSKYLEQQYAFLNASTFLKRQYGLEGETVDGDPDASGPEQPEYEGVRRSSVFVPLEMRARVAELLWGAGGTGPGGLGEHREAVELGLGHVQIGEQPFRFAAGLNFRVFCATCLWVSVYFYVTEALSSAPGSASILPLAVWRPCRLHASDLFPVRHVQLGRRSSALVPYARQEASGEGAVEPQLEGFRQQRQDILHGSCRESLQRGLGRLGHGVLQTPASGRGGARLPPAVPELLPFHDISHTISWGTNLEMLMAVKQVHAGQGLEHYQDKIALSQEFKRRGLRVPRLYFASYDPDFDMRPTLRRLAEEGRPYVAKASHMCCSMGVFVMQDGVDHATGRPYGVDEIQDALRATFDHPFQAITSRCGDWGTVEAGRKPGVLVEELMRPSLPVAPLLEPLGGGEWITPDIVACHLVWSAILFCTWEIKLRTPEEPVHTAHLGTFFRDGSCFKCTHPRPFGSRWPAVVSLLEGLLPHADYLRITLFIQDGQPVLNEIEYTSGGLETIPLPLAREWTLRWLEGYYMYYA